MDTYSLVSRHPLLAILRNVPLEKTIDYAEAAVQGGAPFFEVALNSPHALEQITMLRTHFGDRCTVGAGTAITVERCRAALDAGAQFLLTPGTPTDVLAFCAREDVPLLPGVLTPADVATSLEYGFKTMKLFPAGSMPRQHHRVLRRRMHQRGPCLQPDAPGGRRRQRLGSLRRPCARHGRAD